jgi:hypothetical protein
MTKNIYIESAERVSSKSVNKILRAFKEIGVSKGQAAESLGISRQALTSWTNKGVIKLKFDVLVDLYSKKYADHIVKKDGYKPQRPAGRIHLRTKKLFAAGGVELKPKKNEKYTCCTMIVVDDEFSTTDDIKKVTCKGCLKRTHNLH